MTPIPEKTNALLKAQYASERKASATYSAISNALSSTPFKGFAKYFKEEAESELQHSFRFEKYLQDRNYAPDMFSIEAMSYGQLWPIQAVKLACDLEMQVTALINAIYAQAHLDGDYNTCQFLQYFLEEQVKSEAELKQLELELTLAADNSAALLYLDERVGK